MAQMKSHMIKTHTWLGCAQSKDVVFSMFGPVPTPSTDVKTMLDPLVMYCFDCQVGFQSIRFINGLCDIWMISASPLLMSLLPVRVPLKPVHQFLLLITDGSETSEEDCAGSDCHQLKGRRKKWQNCYQTGVTGGQNG